MKVYNESIEEVYKDNTKNVFEFNGGNWRRYFNDLVKGDFCDDIDFKFEDIDSSVIVLNDDGEVLRMKDGSYRNVCWRGEQCRVWRSNKDDVQVYNEKLGG